MSQENVDMLARILEQLFEARRVDPELLARDVEWVNPPEAVEPGTRRGTASFNRAIANVFAAWDDVRFEIERVIDHGDEAVALGLLHGRIHGPGMEVDNPHGQIWSFRDGLVTRMRWFNTHAETLQAAGLPAERA
jgi:ketosteroid isomerase-like protein